MNWHIYNDKLTDTSRYNRLYVGNFLLLVQGII